MVLLKINFNCLIKQLLFVVFFAASTTCFAQQEQEEKEGWNFTIAPYLWVPYTSGDIIIAGNDENIRESPGDILGLLKFGGMLYFEAANPKWSVSADAIFLGLGDDLSVSAPPDSLALNAKLRANATLLGVYGMYRVVQWFEVGIGVRINIMNPTLELTSANTPPTFPQQNFDAPDTWVDPLITYRFNIPFKNKKWHAGVRGDLGGFGVGSDFAWMIFPHGGYQFSRLFELTLGFRAMGMTYNNDTDLKVDLNLYGAQLGFLFHF